MSQEIIKELLQCLTVGFSLNSQIFVSKVSNELLDFMSQSRIQLQGLKQILIECQRSEFGNSSISGVQGTSVFGLEGWFLASTWTDWKTWPLRSCSNAKTGSSLDMASKSSIGIDWDDDWQAVVLNTLIGPSTFAVVFEGSFIGEFCSPSVPDFLVEMLRPCGKYSRSGEV